MAKKPEKKELTDFIMAELGAMLRATREDKGLTRIEVAEKLGMDAEDITRIEQNIGNVTLSQLQRYAEFLNKRVQLKFL